MIKIDVHKKPPPIDDVNEASQGGTRQDIEKAIVILQLDGDGRGPFYTGAEVAATKYERGSEIYVSQQNAFRGRIKSSLVASNIDPATKLFLPTIGQTKFAGYSAPALRSTLSKEAYEVATGLINQTRKRDKLHRAAGRKNMGYWFTVDVGVLEFNLDEVAAPEMPVSHYKNNKVPPRPFPAPEQTEMKEHKGPQEKVPPHPGGTPVPPELKEIAEQQKSIEGRQRPSSSVPVWALVGALAIALGFSLCPQIWGRQNTVPHFQETYPVEYWESRGLQDNRQSLETESDPLQRMNIARANASKTNADRPYVLDETRVMVACDNGRKFVLMPDYAIELGDWVVIPTKGDNNRGALIDLTIKWARLLTPSGVEITVFLPYPKNYVQVSWGMRNIEVLSMKGGNLIRIIDGWCAIRRGFEHGPLFELTNASVIGQFDNFEELLLLSADELGLDLRDGYISPSFAETRCYIRWERPFWCEQSLGDAAKGMSALTGLEFLVPDSDAHLEFGWGSRPLGDSFWRFGVEGYSEGLKIIWRGK